MSTFIERLHEAYEESGIKSYAELARKAGLKSYSTISDLMRGRTQESPQLPKICMALGINVIWLQTGKGPKSIRSLPAEEVMAGAPKDDDYATVPQFHANGSCGNGYLNDHVEVRGSMAFKRDWLARMSIDPEQAGVIYARGDSMQYTISDGEVLLVDYRQTEPFSSKVYVINVDGDLRVKRLFKRVSGWVISSDNPDKARYPDEPIGSISDIKIVGRVVWRGGGI